MNYNELIQLYFERSTAMQQYWNLYVIIVGGVLAFSSLRKQPAAITATFRHDRSDQTIRFWRCHPDSLEASARPARTDSYARHVWKRQGYPHYQRLAYHRRTLRDGAPKKKAQSDRNHALKRSIPRGVGAVAPKRSFTPMTPTATGQSLIRSFLCAT